MYATGVGSGIESNQGMHNIGYYGTFLTLYKIYINQGC